MAFDGITVANIVKELRTELVGGRIYKITQPEKDELLLTVKTANSGQKRLFLSANASLPLVYLTAKNKPGPLTAPGFCMLLRKHLQNGRITDITQPGLERIIHFHIDHLNELGDMCSYKLIIEIMGKHSNIIFAAHGKDTVIIDSIKHISAMVSSIREVLPGRSYFIAETQDKKNPLETTYEEFYDLLTAKGLPLFKALYSAYTGLSPVFAQDICYRAALDGDLSTTLLRDEPDKAAGLYRVFSDCMELVRAGEFSPVIYSESGKPVEYASLSLPMYCYRQTTCYKSVSEMLERYYAEKNTVTRIRQKSADLRRIVQSALERNRKKYELQLLQIKDTEKKDRFRIYGELLNTYGYDVSPGAKALEALNYYTNEMISIPLDPDLSSAENAKKYFDKYGKLKRTAEALSSLILEVQDEIRHLESIATALNIALLEEDLVQIKEELVQSGYIRRKGQTPKIKITSKPFHYLSSDGYHMYVGKNNYQNEELTFRLAEGQDWWFHAKGIPGSHVIVKSGGNELPDATFEEAARLAAYYSKGQGDEKVEVDYTQKKNVKKPGGGKPGFVVYYTNYSMRIEPDISSIRMSENANESIR